MALSITERLMAKSTIKTVSTLEESKIFENRDCVTLSVPAINIALGGHPFESGLMGGLGVLAGPSKHFKTSFALLMVADYLKKHKDAVCLFYDSEFGASKKYFASFGIDPNRVIHSPIMNIEELKFDLMNVIESISRKDKVIILIDSIGNLASKKEVEDAKNEKGAADMTRAKQLKSVFRMITPYLTINDIPMVAINHTYQTQEMYSKAVVSGGTGIYYSADWIFIIGRQQDKDGKEVIGYDFILNIEKSRHVREKMKVPVSVTFEGGIDRWSGLLDLAKDLGYVTTTKVKSSNGYVRSCIEGDDEIFLTDETSSKRFWGPIFEQTDFADDIAKMFQLSNDEMIAKEEERKAEQAGDDDEAEEKPARRVKTVAPTGDDPGELFKTRRKPGPKPKVKPVEDTPLTPAEEAAAIVDAVSTKLDDATPAVDPAPVKLPDHEVQ